MRLFQNRREAGHELARLLAFLRTENPIILGLANGGVPIAEIIARALDAPLDVLLMERLAAPKNPDHVVGAVDEHGRISMIKSTARWHHLTSQQMVEPARDVFRQLQRRRGQIRAVLPEIEVRTRTVVIVSQGVATGAKMLGAIASVRDRGARKVVVAAPAGAGEAAWQLQDAADLVVIPHRPTKFTGVANLYEDFADVEDEAVLSIVERWVSARPQQEVGVKTLIMKITNEVGNLLCCEIDLPPGTTRGSGPYPTVVFAHGFESDARNPRTVPVSRRLAKRGVIGIRADFTGHGRSEGELADATEDRMYSDLKLILENVRMLDEVDDDRLGVAGSGSGAKLALAFAAEHPAIRTVVARGPMTGGEMDLALRVHAPTLLVYAEQDDAFSTDAHVRGGELPSTHQLLEIPDSTRLFNDAISREMMVSASVDWIVDHIAPLPLGEAEPEPPAVEAPKPDA